MTVVTVDIDALAEVLNHTDAMTALDVALGIAAAGVPVLAVAPRSKAPLLTKEHVPGCAHCAAAGLQPAADHSATTDPDTITRWYTTHPDAGVGLKPSGLLVCGDGDFPDAAALKAARKAVGYGQPDGVPEPCEAHTPGGQYRRRFIHTLPDGVTPPGGGSTAHGVSWYGAKGYVVVKGTHPSTGATYSPFHGEITPLPDSVVTALRGRQGNTDGNGKGLPAATPQRVGVFAALHTGCERMNVLHIIHERVAGAAVGTRHNAAADQLFHGCRAAVAGYVPAQMVFDTVKHALRTAGWDDDRLTNELPALQAWAVGQVEGLTPQQARAAFDQHRADTIAVDYPDAYLDWNEQHAGRDLYGAELERIQQWTQQRDASTDANNDAAPNTLLFKAIPDPFVIPRVEWLARGLWARYTHGELAGPEKSLKTYVSMALDVAVSAGLPVLGQWEVPQPERVLVFVGEGGEGVFLRRLARICDAYGITPRSIRDRLRYTVQVAEFGSVRFMQSLAQQLTEFQPALVHVDPYYAFAPSTTDNRQVTEVGRALGVVGELVQAHGGSLLINNHYNQTGTGSGLRRITGAGHAEWVDSWLLLEHREAPDVDRGRFRLKLQVGSRQWGGGVFDVDYDIGRYDTELDEHDGGITWKVRRHVDSTDTTDTERRKVDDAKLAVLRAWRGRRGPNRQEPLTKSDWLTLVTGHSATHKRAAFAELVDSGAVELVQEQRQNSRGALRPVELYRLAGESAPGALTWSRKAPDELVSQTTSDGGDRLW